MPKMQSKIGTSYAMENDVVPSADLISFLIDLVNFRPLSINNCFYMINSDEWVNEWYQEKLQKHQKWR